VTVVLDTHVLHWISSDPQRISETAKRVIRDADELAVSDITWFELAWLAQRGRITVSRPLERWLTDLSEQVRSIPLTPRIAATAANLAASFPADPADRVIYATALENGWALVTRDERLRLHEADHVITIW
jgi:PIN domain nuclease of toxin-antitoxin system